MKLSCFVLAAVLTVFMVSGAMAQTAPVTKEGVILLEGMQEPVTLTLYESPLGYSLWFDADTFVLAAPDEGSGADAFVPLNPDAVAGVSLHISYSAPSGGALEAVRVDMLEALTADGYAVTEADAAPLFPQYEAYGFHAVKDGSVVEKYIVAALAGVFCLSLEYPLEAAEGFGARLYSMAVTFEPAAAPAQEAD